jgi:hypothetical protein
MVLTYLRFRILDFPLNLYFPCEGWTGSFSNKMLKNPGGVLIPVFGVFQSHISDVYTIIFNILIEMGLH